MNKAAAFGLVLALASWSYATPVTVNITGSWVDYNMTTNGTIGTGSFTGSYTYDPSTRGPITPDSPSGTYVTYDLADFHLDFGDGTIASSGGSLTLRDDWGVVLDAYEVIPANPSGTGVFAGTSVLWALLPNQGIIRADSLITHWIVLWSFPTRRRS